MATLAQTITVVKGKKVVSTSKQLINVFKEAKAAYREKKAELKTTRDTHIDSSNLRSIGDVSTDDRDRRTHAAGYESPPSPRRYYHDERPREVYEPEPRRPLERGYSDSFFVNDDESQLGHQPHSPWGDPRFAQSDLETTMLSRSYSATNLRQARGVPYSGAIPGGVGFEDYLTDSQLPPPLPPRRFGEAEELRIKVFSLNNMLTEFNCIEHSARAIIKHLETNPEAMAAVALTLAEISNILTKMAPGALLSFRAGAPAVVALLLSPEFLIAAGVGVGLTVVALGGYKIIKRIKAKKQAEREPEADELEDVTADLDRIKTWRRGVSEADAESMGTSIEGEFITPMASQQFRNTGVLPNRESASPTQNIRRSQSEPREVVKSSGRAGQGRDTTKQRSALRNMFKRKPDAI